jgi:hypothetical protein
MRELPSTLPYSITWTQINAGNILAFVKRKAGKNNFKTASVEAVWSRRFIGFIFVPHLPRKSS